MSSTREHGTSIEQKPELIVGIDLGTTFTGEQTQNLYIRVTVDLHGGPRYSNGTFSLTDTHAFTLERMLILYEFPLRRFVLHPRARKIGSAASHP
jgi:hypothetical protein